MQTARVALVGVGLAFGSLQVRGMGEVLFIVLPLVNNARNDYSYYSRGQQSGVYVTT